MLWAGAPALAKDYLTVGILGSPRNLNPFQATDAWTRNVISILYQPLYLVNPEDMSLIPWLAEDLPVYDAEKKIVTFHLREMQWDDGTEFSAEDMVFTGEIIRRLDENAAARSWTTTTVKVDFGTGHVSPPLELARI